jgi:hypothetical protein
MTVDVSGEIRAVQYPCRPRKDIMGLRDAIQPLIDLLSLRRRNAPRDCNVLRFPKERCADNIPTARPCGENDDRSLVKSEHRVCMSRFCTAALDPLAGRQSVRLAMVLGDRAR